MSTVVSVMDEDSWDARTDNIAVVEPARKRILWIPRDLWCPGLDNRINRAFAIGGHELLIDGLCEHSIHVYASICIRRGAVARALKYESVWVPIERPMKFWYPLWPLRPTEEARKLVEFHPPGELLTGERIHYWLGARKSLDGDNSDLHRLERHKVFVRSLLAGNFDFSRLPQDKDRISIFGTGAFEDLRQVRADWKQKTLGPLVHARIRGMQVVVKKSRLHPLYLVRDAYRYGRTALERRGLRRDAL